MRVRRVHESALLAVAAACLGCAGDALPPEPELVPVIGRVTVQGAPLADAVITFLQVDEKGTLAVGGTDEEGNYVLTHAGRQGTAPATYQVRISYKVGTDGTVYDLASQSGLAQPYGLNTAKELVPDEWSDYGQLAHRVTVGPGGGVFDFDIAEPLLPPPEPSDDQDGAEGPPPEVPVTGNPVPGGGPAP